MVEMELRFTAIVGVPGAGAAGRSTKQNPIWNVVLIPHPHCTGTEANCTNYPEKRDDFIFWAGDWLHRGKVARAKMLPFPLPRDWQLCMRVAAPLA